MKKSSVGLFVLAIVALISIAFILQSPMVKAERTLTDDYLTANATVVKEGDQISVGGSYDASGTAGAEAWTLMLNETNNDVLIDADCNDAGDVARVVSIPVCDAGGGGSCTINGFYVDVVWKLNDEEVNWILEICSGASVYSPLNFITFENTTSATSDETLNDQTGDITVDATAPHYINYTSPGNNTNQSSNIVEFNFTVRDNQSSVMNCSLYLNDSYNTSNTNSLNDTSADDSQTNNITLWLAEGGYIWNITCTDEAGNENTASMGNYTITVDTTAPASFSFIAPTPDNDTNLSQDNYFTNITFTESGVGLDTCLLELTNASGTVNYTMSKENATTCYFNVTSQSDYREYFYVYANDTAGNLGRSDARFITLDTAPPYAVTHISPVNDTNSSSRIIEFNFTVLDAIFSIGMNCSLYLNDSYNTSNTQVQNNTESNITVNMGSDGVWLWNISCADPLGNENTTEDNRTITVDTTKPDITLNAPDDNNVTTDNYIEFNFTPTDNLAPVLNCSIYFNETIKQSNSSIIPGQENIFNVTSIADGDYTWNITCNDSAGNANWSLTRSFEMNLSPSLTSVTDSPDPVKGGNIVTITAVGEGDPNSDTLEFFCDTSTEPTTGNTDCVGGTLSDDAPYDLSCLILTAETDQPNTIYCRARDGVYYSPVQSTTYTTDSTPPVTSIASVAGDTVAIYYDNESDDVTTIIIDSLPLETNMLCRWNTSDVEYSNISLTNECSISGSQATCSPATTTQGLDAYNFYVSCRDSVGNEQTITQNNDITSLVTDWTAPNTTDNSSTDVVVPNYTIRITEDDNLAYTAWASFVTYYCADTSGSCSPSDSISGATETITVQFNDTNRGRNYIRYYSLDPAGNSQTIQNQSININQLPVFTSASDNATTIKGGSGVLITTVSYDADNQNLSLYVCKTDGVNTSGCTGDAYCSNASASANSSCYFTAETDSAAHNWYAFLYDSLNESAAANKSGSYTTDSTPPTISIIYPENTTYTQDSVPSSISLDEDGDWAGYELDGASNVTMNEITSTSWSKTITSVSDGSHTIIFYANDSYANMGDSSTMVFTVNTTIPDTTPPTITVMSPTNGTYHNTSTVLANITLSEAGAWAAYSLNETANVTMENLTSTEWNYTISVSEGYQNLTFYANDSSGNIGNSSLIFFTVDRTPPQYTLYNNTPLNPNDTQAVTCFSYWTDSVNIDYVIIEENATGTATNHTVAVSSTSGWGNYTINSSTLNPGTVQCRFYSNDTLENLNSTPVLKFDVNDSTAPNLYNISYLPNTSAELDVNTRVNITANVTDYVNVSSVLLQYKEWNASSWSSFAMNNTTASDIYEGNFTPDVSNTWTFRINATDNSGNENISSEYNLTIENDQTWNYTTTIPTVKSTVQDQTRFFSVGNLTINDTGDYGMNFTVFSNVSWITFNGTGNNSITFNLSVLNNETTFNVTANTTGFAVGLYNYKITITADISGTNVSSEVLNKIVNIQNVPGPYFSVSITAYDSNVTQGDTGIILTSSITNLGTADATGVWLAWTLPSGFSNTSGVLNKSIGFLGVGESTTISVTVSVSSTASTGAKTLTATAGSSEGVSGSDSKSVTINVAEAAPSPSTTVTYVGGGGGIWAGEVENVTKTIEKILTGEEILSSSETFELVRGQEDTFPVSVKNIFEDTTLYNVSIKLEGYLSQYITFSPSMINEIAYNETKQFNVTIISPEYMEQGTHELSITIVGKIIGPGVEKDLTETRSVTLDIHVVSKEEASSSTELAITDISDMADAGFPTSKISKLLEEAEKALEEHDYEKAKELTETIKTMKEKAFEAHALIQEVKSRMKGYGSITGAFLGIQKNFPETESLVNLAQAAFEREDYEAALQRARDAQMALALEAGEFNLIYFLADWWWAILMGIALSSLAGFFAYQRYMIATISQKIRNLHREEENINNLMKEAQRSHFKEKTMGTATFHKTLEQYHRRLTKIRQLRAKLRHKRVRLLKPQEVIKDLEKEGREIMNLLKKAQEDYLEKGVLSRTAYREQANFYNGRVAEIEDERMTLETKFFKGGGKK